MESPNLKHQGELSLLEMIQNMKSPDPKGELPSALLVIELNEERQRRQVIVILYFI